VYKLVAKLLSTRRISSKHTYDSTLIFKVDLELPKNDEYSDFIANIVSGIEPITAR